MGRDTGGCAVALQSLNGASEGYVYYSTSHQDVNTNQHAASAEHSLERTSERAQGRKSRTTPSRFFMRYLKKNLSPQKKWGKGLCCGTMSKEEAAELCNLNAAEGSCGTRIVKEGGGGTLQDWVTEGHRVFGSYGLEVLTTNVHGKETKKQKGWHALYFSLKKLGYSKYGSEIRGYRQLFEKPAKGVKRDRQTTRRDNLLWLYEHGVISESGVYAIFADTFMRQNLPIVIGKDAEKKVIDNYSARFNRSRAAGYHVRKRMKNQSTYAENPIMVTLTISREKIEPLMPNNTNLDPVMFSIWNIGSWIRDFQRRLFMYQQRREIKWSFLGWVLEFQGEKEDTEERKYLNRGYPHPHIIYDSKWMGDIREIQELWSYGIVELTTKRDIIKRYPDRKYDRLSVANYISKYLTKARLKAVGALGVHKGYAWLAFSGGRIFSIKHEKKKISKSQKN